MKVAVAGGTGFIGRALCRDVASAGHEVIVLSRRPPRDSAFPAVAWDAKSSGSWQSALEGAGALINLSGESIAQGRWTAGRKKALVDSRLLSTRALVAGLSAVKNRPKIFICASAVGFYGDRGDEELTEASQPGSDFLAKLCSDWEREAQIAETLGIRTVSLRIGVVLHKDGGALAKMLLPFKLGLGGPLGSGRQWMSWIARDDLTALILHLLQKEITGAVNATAPKPVTNREFAQGLGKALGRPAFLPAPAFALRLALGEMADMLLGGQKVLPKRALESGYSFKRPDIDSALKAAL